MRRMGSAAMDLAYVAAGALLVREAGGLVTDADGGQTWLRSGHIVAAGPGLHEQIRSEIEHGE